MSDFPPYISPNFRNTPLTRGLRSSTLNVFPREIKYLTRYLYVLTTVITGERIVMDMKSPTNRKCLTEILLTSSNDKRSR